MTTMRDLIVLVENMQRGTYRLFHGSPYPNISEFRLDNLRHRTGTPGTLSFTTSPETAKIYGPYIYETEISGQFGDYLNHENIEQNFQWRWASEQERVTFDFPKYQAWCARFKKPVQTLDERLLGCAERLRQEITEGRYAMWEHVEMWRSLGWDGAWCIEHGSRNLIIGNIACVRSVVMLKSGN